MTKKEIQKLRDEIPRYKDGVYCNFTHEQERLQRELDCRDMINSCLCYGYNFLESNYSKAYIIELGIERVTELYNEQKADIEKSTILYDIGKDGEGNYYNSIKWYDEIDVVDKDITDDMC